MKEDGGGKFEGWLASCGLDDVEIGKLFADRWTLMSCGTDCGDSAKLP